MSDMINRDTKEVKFSGNRGIYKDPPWLPISHDLALLCARQRREYIVINDNNIHIMNEEEKAQYLAKYREEHPIHILPPVRSRITILADIFDNVQSQEQARRLVLAIRKYSEFTLFLDSRNFDLARVVIDEAVSEGDITADDAIYIKDRIPSQGD